MKFLKHLFENNIDDLTSRSEQLNAYPEATMDQLRKLIREGTKPNKETGQYEKWGSALQLVHQAFTVAGVQRPTPQMKEMWKQYEELIAYAVKELAKTRGLDADWRMTASELEDAYHFAVNGGILLEIDGETVEVLEKDTNEVINVFQDIGRRKGYDIQINNNEITFWKYGIKQKHNIKIL